MQNAIHDILSSRTKEEIEATLDYFDALPLRVMRKKELVRTLSSYLSAPKVWLNKLMEQDLRLLQTLCKAGPGNSVEIIPGDYPSVVEVLHFVDSDSLVSSSKDTCLMSIPIAFYELISNDIDAVIESKESDGSFALEHLILGAVNIYGAVPLRTFVDCIFDDFDDFESMRAFAESVAAHPVIRLYQEEYKGEAYLVSPFVENFDELMKRRRERFKGLRRYAKATREQAESCGSNSPFCSYGLDTPEGKALLDMLYTIGYEGESLMAAAHTVWLNSQYEPDRENLDMLMSPLSAAVADIESEELFFHYAGILLEYANSVPKWLLKGHSAESTGLMVYEAGDEYLCEVYGSDQQNVEDESVLKLFERVNKVHPVAPDAPCPCGSGLSYRLCHGKLFS